MDDKTIFSEILPQISHIAYVENLRHGCWCDHPSFVLDTILTMISNIFLDELVDLLIHHNRRELLQFLIRYKQFLRAHVDYIDFNFLVWLNNPETIMAYAEGNLAPCLRDDHEIAPELWLKIVYTNDYIYLSSHPFYTLEDEEAIFD